MVNIHTAEENVFIRDLITREAPNLNWWIGAYDNGGEWQWTDIAESDAPLTFQFWSDDPNPSENAKCAYFDVMKLKWERAPCDGSTENDMFYYICETSASQLDHPNVLPIPAGV